MELSDLHRLFREAHRLTGHAEFVVVGSLAALGAPREGNLPARMILSIDVDAYTKADPARIFELQSALGQGSAFEMAHGYYLDPVSPALPTLPDGWEGRLYRIAFGDGIVAHFLDPNDAAVSKYARCEPRDREWLRAGLAAGILSAPIIEYRMRETVFADDEERQRATEAFVQDRSRARASGRKGR
ncbi:MAG TPA: hypothetical protein PLD37_09475 [Usitatibacteraceae bacterium]|nr:hypothetical protein [Usitatibacteraceae bacterium]